VRPLIGGALACSVFKDRRNSKPSTGYFPSALAKPEEENEKEERKEEEAEEESNLTQRNTEPLGLWLCLPLLSDYSLGHFY
jgi:hypothetical protein